MPAKQGKQATKGKKLIAEENKQTMNFYTYIIGGVNAFYLIMTYVFFWDSFTTLPTLLVGVCLVAYFASYQFMASMARVTYDAAGNLLDGGIDLNMEEGMAENAKDLILLTAITQLLALLSSYFWLLLLLAPGRAIYMLWVKLLAPWFFAPAPEVDEKKQKKMERKMKRQR